MFSHPAFVACHHGSDAQRETFFAEQGVAAVAGTIAPDLAGLWEVCDVFLVDRCAWPGDIFFAFGEWFADGMQAWHEEAIVTETVEHFLTGAGHDLHVQCDVWAVGELYADAGSWAVDRSHAEWDHVQGAALHGTVIKLGHGTFQFLWWEPVVGRTSVFFFLAGDEGAPFDTRNVGNVGSEEVAVWQFFRIEFYSSVLSDKVVQDLLLLFVRILLEKISII